MFILQHKIAKNKLQEVIYRKEYHKIAVIAAWYCFKISREVNKLKRLNKPFLLKLHATYTKYQVKNYLFKVFFFLLILSLNLIFNLQKVSLLAYYQVVNCINVHANTHTVYVQYVQYILYIYI